MIVLKRPPDHRIGQGTYAFAELRFTTALAFDTDWLGVALKEVHLQTSLRSAPSYYLPAADAGHVFKGTWFLLSYSTRTL